jgi:hypothetical protein
MRRYNNMTPLVNVRDTGIILTKEDGDHYACVYRKQWVCYDSQDDPLLWTLSFVNRHFKTGTGNQYSLTNC